MEKSMYTISPPLYRAGGTEHPLEKFGDAYRDANFTVSELRAKLDSQTLSVRRTWRNISCAPIAFQPVFEARAGFICRHYVIPCVNINGNTWGHGNEPKGLTRDGKPWIFSYQRMGIPSCTVSENDAHVFGMFASDESRDSLVSSCSLIMGMDGCMIHRILYPIIEEPYTYCDRDKYCEPCGEFITLAPGQEFSATVFLYSGEPIYRNFGAANVQNKALELLHGKFAHARPTAELWRLGLEYARTLSTEIEGCTAFRIGSTPGKNGTLNLTDHFEFGWCGQNGTYARMFILDYIKTGNQDSLKLGLACLDSWVKKCVRPCGLMCANLQVSRATSSISDTCNLGFEAAELSRSYSLLKGCGIDRPEYLAAAQGICDFMCAHYSAEYGFGKAWSESGELIDPNGTIGAYMVMGLVECWRACGRAEYLKVAQTAFRFYCTRDLDEFVCTAGALDTCCIDKETACALVIGGMLLYEQTKDAYYLDKTIMAGYYFCAWMYHYDAIYDPESDFAKYGYTTTGGTAVSAQHHHIDQFGALLVPYFHRLGEITGDARWQKRARMMWSNATQCVSDGDFTVHGFKRPAGAQNEAFLQCRWKWKEARSDFESGNLNDWFVAWMGAFRLLAISSMPAEALEP